MRAQLETDQRALGTDGLTAISPQLAAGTAAAKFLAVVSSLTKPEVLRALTHLSDKEQARLAFLDKALLDQKANDPEKLAQQLTLRHGRVTGLARHLGTVEDALSAKSVSEMIDARKVGSRKAEEAKRLREATFPAGLLAGTGTENWAAMWEAARSFSEEVAYPGQAFPVTAEGAQCVLCQRSLDHAAAHRFEQFQSFVISKTESELRHLRESFARHRKAFLDLRIQTEAVEEALKEIALDQQQLATEIGEALAGNEARRKAILACLAADGVLPSDLHEVVPVSETVAAVASQLQERIRLLRASVNKGPLVVSCGTQHSELLVVVEPGGHVGRLHLSLSTCPPGSSQEDESERWSRGAVHQRVGPAAAVGG